ncbi:MAG: hypothetical protein IIA58_04080 [Candidatus Marinimicrobia bacterium]|nr:hypothetical protein [Candidatus Neomarinimicrobiota bacterium]
MKLIRISLQFSSLLFLLTVVHEISHGQDEVSDLKCLECHSDISQLGELAISPERLFINPDFTTASVHGELNCTGCHADPGGYPHPEVVGIIECGKCHVTETKEYLAGPHGNPLSTSLDITPNCLVCHQLHLIRSSDDEESLTHINNEWKTCAQCHTERIIKSKDSFIQSINKSALDDDMGFVLGIHNSVIRDGLDAEMLTCTVCHGAHNTVSEVGKDWTRNISDQIGFCGSCHQVESVQFAESVHSKTKISTITGEVPFICTDCHSEHRDLTSEISGRKESSSTLVTDKCLECHLPVSISMRYSINWSADTPAVESFHGIKSLHGNLTFQNCSSCHGIHDLNSLKETLEENSKLSLSINCGGCHPNAATDFAGFPVHLTINDDSADAVKLARYIVTILVGAVLFTIVVSIMGDFYRYFTRKLK